LFTGFIRDLTAKEQDELRLKELQAELVHVSRLSAMGTMASTLAHELNQPLAAVALYLETIRDMLDERDDEPFVSLRSVMDDAARKRCGPAISSGACAISSPAARSTRASTICRRLSPRRAARAGRCTRARHPQLLRGRSRRDPFSSTGCRSSRCWST
jgi:signal transduction histidine kinase